MIFRGLGAEDSGVDTSTGTPLESILTHTSADDSHTSDFVERLDGTEEYCEIESEFFDCEDCSELRTPIV